MSKKVVQLRTNLADRMVRISNRAYTVAREALFSDFPGYFDGSKHNHYADYGYPKALNFAQLYHMYSRNSLAGAAVEKTADKVWQEFPKVVVGTDTTHPETATEKVIREHFRKIRFWQKMKEAYRRSLVGDYSGVILRFADGKDLDQPVGDISAGIDTLLDVIPAWESQLTVSEWDEDINSDTYGQPLMFQFNETAAKNKNNRGRNVDVHPDRVIIWSRDGTIFGRSLLRAGYNDLLDIEKVTGAGGESFWKNAKGGAFLKVDPEVDLQTLMESLEADDMQDMTDKMDEKMTDFNRGLDKILMLQGINPEQPFIKMPSPEHFRLGPLQNFCASVSMPMKIMIGMQTGERASGEDANEWAQTCMSRRNEVAVPCILSLFDRLADFGIVDSNDWNLKWQDLTEGTLDDRIERSRKMSESNRLTGLNVFSPEEIRDTVGYGEPKHTVEPMKVDQVGPEGQPKDDPTDEEPNNEEE